MSVNPDLAGRVFPPGPPYLVGREKAREFARAVFSADPVNFDPAAAEAAGHSGLVTPPTFAVVVQEPCLDRLLAEPGTGIDLAQVLHGEQRFHYTRPIVAGDELTAQLSVTGVRSLAGNAMVTARTRITDTSGADVVTATSVLVVRSPAEPQGESRPPAAAHEPGTGRNPEVRPDAAVPAETSATAQAPETAQASATAQAPGTARVSAPAQDPAADPHGPAATPLFASLAAGDVVARRRFTLGRDSLVRYAGASGDFNPVHYRDDVAARLGLPGVLAHGMLTMGLAVQPVMEWLGDPGRLTDYGVRFTRPVVVAPDGGAQIEVAASVGVLDPATHTARIDIRAVSAGTTVLGKAQAFVVLP